MSSRKRAAVDCSQTPIARLPLTVELYLTKKEASVNKMCEVLSIKPHCHHDHGHWVSVKKTCWNCNGTGVVCGHDHWYWPSVTWSSSTSFGCSTNCNSMGCCHCCCHRTCPSCFGMGYTYESEWVPNPWPCLPHCPPKIPCSLETPWSISSGKKPEFRQGVGVNKVRTTG